MINTFLNIEVIKKIATALGELNEAVVYVGGAVVSLYINDPAADDIRPTKDIDIFLEIATLAELEEVRLLLKSKGFHQNAEDDVVCRFRFKGVKVDVMSTKEIGWAPANKWFASGLHHLNKVEIGNKQIRILSLPYFLASKFSAFENRGKAEPRTSRDFEDITYILDNRTDLIEELKKAPKEVLAFLNTEFQNILSLTEFQEAILGNLYYDTQQERLEIILNKLKQIINHNKSK